MYRRHIRPMNDRERAKLREFSEVPDPLTTADLLWRLLLVAAAVAVVAVPVWSKGGPAAIYPPLVLGAFAIVGMSLFQFFRDRRIQAELAEREQQVLADGHVEVEQFQVRRAIELETGQGDGAMFVLELSDGRVAFLSGEFLSHTDDDLPSTDFELVMTRACEVWLGIFSTGQELATPVARAPAGFPPRDFDELVFVRGTLDEKITDLCRRAAESPQSH